MGVFIIQAVKVIFGITVTRDGDFHKKNFLETESILKIVPVVGDFISIDEVEYTVKTRLFDFDDEVIRIYLDDSIMHSDEDYYEEINRLSKNGWV